jgi:hypothetical protein
MKKHKKPMSAQMKFIASEEQVQDFELRCDLGETLMAETLAKRLHGLDPKSSVPVILSLFASIRNMAITNFIVSGIRVEMAPPERGVANSR